MTHIAWRTSSFVTLMISGVHPLLRLHWLLMYTKHCFLGDRFGSLVIVGIIPSEGMYTNDHQVFRLLWLHWFWCMRPWWFWMFMLFCGLNDRGSACLFVGLLFFDVRFPLWPWLSLVFMLICELLFDCFSATMHCISMRAKKYVLEKVISFGCK